LEARGQATQYVAGAVYNDHSLKSGLMPFPGHIQALKRGGRFKSYFEAGTEGGAEDIF